MTEKEAKKKWCPMIRFQIGLDNAAWQGVAYTNRGEEMRPPESVRCITSECMMWRWYTLDKEEGYCGLGGEP